MIPSLNPYQCHAGVLAGRTGGTTDAGRSDGKGMACVDGMDGLKASRLVFWTNLQNAVQIVLDLATAANDGGQRSFSDRHVTLKLFLRSLKLGQKKRK